MARLRVKEPVLTALAMLLVAGTLLALTWGLVTLTTSAGEMAPCQPLAGVTLAYTPTHVYPDVPVLFAAEIVTGSLPVTYTWNIGDATPLITGTAVSSPFTATHGYTASGVYDVVLSAWNTCTVPPLTSTILLTVEARSCVTLTGLALTCAPTQVYTYTDVLFTGQVVTGSLPVTYTWAFDDGAQPVTGTTATPTFTTTHTFTTTRAHTVTLAAWNVCTVTPAQQAVTLDVGPCEVISGLRASHWPADPWVGQVVTFTASVTGGSPPWEVDWAFGDGHTATGAVVTHAYTAPLTYTLVLTAWNPCSQQATTATVAMASLPQFFLPLAVRAFEPPSDAHLGYGANIASADHAISLTVMGFDWAKGFVAWQDAGGGPNYNWIAVDNQLGQFLPGVPHVLLRISGPTPPGINNPPVSPGDLAAFHDFTQALAVHVSGIWRVQGLESVAYEIWNEPNLDYEWGAPPNAAQYTALLQAGYTGIKAGDPDALVVSAGLATTGGSAADLAWARQFYGTTQVVPDLTFLRNMYLHGAKGHFDALGSHPYGGPDAPDTPPDQATGPIYFRRAEEQHQVMLDNNDPSPVWATEIGWVLETGCDLGEHEWMEVSEAQQAEYLVAAYAYADAHWPWMGPMFLFNLDFATVYWYPNLCDPMRWYSITYRENPQDPGNSPILPRQAFYSLGDMPKHSAW
jgi:PKD repeat protein